MGAVFGCRPWPLVVDCMTISSLSHTHTHDDFLCASARFLEPIFYFFVGLSRSLQQITSRVSKFRCRAHTSQSHPVPKHIIIQLELKQLIHEYRLHYCRPPHTLMRLHTSNAVRTMSRLTPPFDVCVTHTHTHTYMVRVTNDKRARCPYSRFPINHNHLMNVVRLVEVCRCAVYVTLHKQKTARRNAEPLNSSASCLFCSHTQNVLNISQTNRHTLNGDRFVYDVRSHTTTIDGVRCACFCVLLCASCVLVRARCHSHSAVCINLNFAATKNPKNSTVTEERERMDEMEDTKKIPIFKIEFLS